MRIIRYLHLGILFGVLFSAGNAGDLNAVRKLKIDDGKILSVRRITNPVHSDGTGNLPARTIVKLVLMPAKGSCSYVEVWLPDDDQWNSRFAGIGNGGAAGGISETSLIDGLKRGYAVATTDMGTAPEPDCGIQNPEVWKDFGFRATHLMTVAAKQIIEVFYKKPPAYSYFSGGSTGGQQALQEAQRYPEDYDGIAARVPAHCRTPLHAYFLWNYQLAQQCRLTREQDQNLITAAVDYMARKEKPPFAGKMISDPRCSAQDVEAIIELAMKRDATLTPKHAECLRKIFDGPKSPGGERIFNGVPPGSSIINATGHLYLFQWAFHREVKYGALDFEKDMDTCTRLLAPYLNAENPDLSRFHARGGKLLMLSGTADSVVPYHATLDYYERCAENAGSMEKLQDFFRYYLVPGAGHGAGLPGFMDMVVAWREKGVVPEGVDTRLADGTKITLFPYPKDMARGGVERIHPRYSPPAAKDPDVSR
ncbi:MAG: tannase/feruloyl esterase family alpha/beta hydrolase [Opitutaceae bacterium]|jgi:feruloyl esterase|nr:tannase/feruloyl esterase family alpha/beta hydrolase [Opitutaceae bacterium]